METGLALGVRLGVADRLGEGLRLGTGVLDGTGPPFVVVTPRKKLAAVKPYTPM
jgi:hypothetical protein